MKKRSWIRNHVCAVAGCGSKHHARGFCSIHTARFRRYGDPLYLVPPSELNPNSIQKNFDSNYSVNEKTGCWEWTRGLNQGYGRFSLNGKCIYAHVYSYERSKGPIPTGLEVDHLCRNRCCVNPEHLEAVTRKVNTRRGAGNPGKYKTHCIHGHEYTHENTRYAKMKNGNFQRICRACAKQHALDYREKIAKAINQP